MANSVDEDPFKVMPQFQPRNAHLKPRFQRDDWLIHVMGLLTELKLETNGERQRTQGEQREFVFPVFENFK